MGADRRDRVQRARLVAIAGDVAAVDLEDRRLAGRELVEAVRLARQIAADQMRGGRRRSRREFLRAGDRLDPGRVEQLEPGIVAAFDQVGDQDRGGGAVGDAPGVEAGRDQIAVAAATRTSR